MKKFVVAAAAVAAFGFVGAASAADMAVKAPIYKAPPVALYNWTGFYVGVQVGWSHIRDTQDLSSPSFALSVSDTASGVVGGVHAGYNFQVNQFVYGIEGDFEGNSTDHTFLVGFPFSADTSATQKLRWQGSLRGRLGVAFDRVLFYGTGGWAFGGFEDSYVTPSTIFAESVSSTRNGWTAGGGVEYAFWSNLTARAEFRYTDWGSHTNALNVFLSPPGTSVDHVRQSVVRVGLSYKFGP
jgi:outer membrane immunogenic protein